MRQTPASDETQSSAMPPSSRLLPRRRKRFRTPDVRELVSQTTQDAGLFNPISKVIFTMMITMTQQAQAGEGVYARLVDEVRDALTARELAEVAGVGERQVHYWSAGTSRPRGRARDRLLEVHYLVGNLLDVYAPEGVEVFLHGRNRELGGRRPLDLMRRGEFEPVAELVERLRAGAA